MIDFWIQATVFSLIITPILAAQIGRRWWLWLILTFFSGPFALLALFLKGRPEELPVASTYAHDSGQLTSNSDPKFDMSVSGNSEEENTMSSIEVIDDLAGYVYVISNPLFPSLVKIGYTSKSPEERIEQLDSTGLPEKFVEHYRIKARDARSLEKKLHKHFESHRYSENREFFMITPQEVYQVLLNWGVDPLEI